jgi:hypothetical protein
MLILDTIHHKEINLWRDKGRDEISMEDKKNWEKGNVLTKR